MLGLVSVSFRKHSPAEILQAVKEAGLQAVEWGSDVHAPCEDGERLREIAALQKEYGVICSSYGSYFRMGQNKPEEIRPYLAAAKLLGTDTVRIWCGCSSPGKCRQCAKHNLGREAVELAKIAQEENAVLCLECHNNTLTEEVESALQLLRQVDSPHFQMYWQPNQYRSLEQNLAYAQAVAEYVKLLHVFHWQGDRKLPLKEAVGEWKQYLSAVGKKVPLLLEFMPDDDIRSLTTEADALREIARGVFE